MRLKTLLLSFVVIVFVSVSVAQPTPSEDYRKALSLLLANDSQSDQNDAVNLLRRAADQGYAPAQTTLGTIYEQGFIVMQDVQSAISWYKKAADQGDWIAQFSLGRIYFLGRLVPRDLPAAKKWLEQAAADPRIAEPRFFSGC